MVAIAVLIVTCPCAVALAVPAVQVVVAGALFKLGVLLNKGDAIERLAEADTIVFDKTGTLTCRTRRWRATRRPISPVAARLALSSRHPLARALARTRTASAPYRRGRGDALARRQRHGGRPRGAAWRARFLRRCRRGRH